MVLADNAVLVTGLNESMGVLDGKPFKLAAQDALHL